MLSDSWNSPLRGSYFTITQDRVIATVQRLSACMTEILELSTYVVRSFQLRAFVAHPNMNYADGAELRAAFYTRHDPRSTLAAMRKAGSYLAAFQIARLCVASAY